MRVWTLCNGSEGYLSPGELDRDVEEFDSLRQAKDMFWRQSEYLLGVGDDFSWNVYFYDPTDESNGPGDPYPDRRLTIGPRGGIRVEHC